MKKKLINFFSVLRNTVLGFRVFNIFLELKVFLLKRKGKVGNRGKETSWQKKNKFPEGVVFRGGGKSSKMKENMTEVEYEYECSRAELLGLPKPSKEEFLSREGKPAGIENAEEEEIILEQAEENNVRQEGFHRIGGGLDELNSILSSTQKKLNRFKMVCGSFSSLLKLHVGAKKEEENIVAHAVSGNETLEGKEMKKAGDPQLDKLDSLISKAERAELSLSSQNKQMRKFLN